MFRGDASVGQIMDLFGLRSGHLAGNFPIPIVAGFIALSPSTVVGIEDSMMEFQMHLDDLVELLLLRHCISMVACICLLVYVR